MKALYKILFSCALALFIAPSFSQGGFVYETDKTGTVENYSRIISIQEARKKANNTYVSLEGFIIGKAKSINPEEFMFRDESDTIKIEVNNDVWRDQKVTPNTKIRILGQVDHNPVTGTTEIEVRQLDIIKK